MSTESFLDSIRKATGGAPSSSEIVPGKLVRFATSDRKGDEAGWCKLFYDGTGGVFGCWRTGISEIWQANSVRSPEEQADFLVRVKQAKEEAAIIETELRARCRRVSAELWEKGLDVDARHSYLTSKGIKPHGIKQLRNLLLVPIRDNVGTIHGLQFIMPDGVKRFKSGTVVAGCYHAIGKVDGKILIAEGFATAATLHEISGHAVACAFTAGNLKPVAEALRAKLPETILIICADDDHTTDGNPGLTKATKAARTVGGLLAIPAFPDTRTPKDTDFNDMARLSGPEAVKACIEAAVIPTPAAENTSPAEIESHDNPLDAAIQRLSKLSPLQYDQVRKKEAKVLGVRPGTLDAAVKDARKGTMADDLPFAEVEPWPDAIDPAQLLADIAATVRRFIVCEKEIAHTVALWAAMTWFIEVVQVAPLAVITAPEKRCGKSQLLFLLGRLSARAITTSSISPAALYRTIDAWCPTLLIDEADAFMRDNEELRGLLNSGHTRESAYVIRTVGDFFTPTKFNTWGAKALAGIGHVADTLMDRAVILELRRKLPHEEVDRIRHAEPGLFADLQSKLARFAEDYCDQVRQARPPLPHNLNDRAQDNWEPLLAIALAAGDKWLQLGTAAALKLSGSESAVQTIGTELLADIQEIFGDDRDRITTADLIRLLCADEEKPWATFNRGHSITPRQVAKRLKEYGIISHTIRIGIETAKGYTIYQFREAFSRYLSSPPETSVTMSQTNTYGKRGRNAQQSWNMTANCVVRKLNTRRQSGCTCWRSWMAAIADGAETEGRYTVSTYTELLGGISETISMGLTDSRDGRSLTKGRKRELVILPSEIQSLKKREAYVKFPEHNPVLLKVEITKANKLPDVTEPFIMRPGLTLDSIIKRQEEISIKASALTEGVEISEEPDGSRQKTDVLKDVAKETMENDSPV